jgi:hypothetical protein
VLGCIPPGVSAARTRELLSAAGRWQDAPWYGIRRALAPFSLPIRLLWHPQPGWLGSFIGGRDRSRYKFCLTLI